MYYIKDKGVSQAGVYTSAYVTSLTHTNLYQFIRGYIFRL
jgi:hypothetical protein